MRRMNEDFELDRKPLTWNYAVSVLKTFVHYYGPHRRLFYLSMTCALAQAAFTTIIPLLVYDAFNTYLPARDYRMIWITVCLLAVLTILVALAMFVCTKYGHVLGVRMEADMRNDLFAHLQRLSFKYFDKAKTGHLMSRVTNDLTMIAELAHHGPEDMSSALLMLIGALVVMFCINPLLTVITLIPLPFIFLWAYLFQGKMRRGFRAARREVAEINSQVENSIQGIREVKSFTNERREIMRFRRVNSSYRHVREGIFDAMAKFHSGVMFFIQGYSILFIIVGMILMYFDKANVIQIMTFFMYSKSVTMPVMRIVEFAEQFHQGVTAYERFYEILQVSPDIREKPEPLLPAAPFKGDLELDQGGLFLRIGKLVALFLDLIGKIFRHIGRDSIQAADLGVLLSPVPTIAAVPAVAAIPWDVEEIFLPLFRLLPDLGVLDPLLDPLVNVADQEHAAYQDQRHQKTCCRHSRDHRDPGFCPHRLHQARAGNYRHGHKGNPIFQGLRSVHVHPHPLIGRNRFRCGVHPDLPHTELLHTVIVHRLEQQFSDSFTLPGLPYKKQADQTV